MTVSLEDRVRELERFRFTMIGRLNACQTLLFDVWLNLLAMRSADPVATVNALRASWLRIAEAPDRTFLDVNPAHLDLVNQEYRHALDKLTGELVRLAQTAKPAQEPPTHSEQSS
jgi:hypothetical protein